MSKWLLRLKPFMAPDDGANLGGESEEMEEVAELPEEDNESEEEEEVAELPEDKTDSAFAEMRRRIKELEDENKSLNGRNKEYDEALGMFFEGDDKIAQALAHYESISVDEARARIDDKKNREEQAAANESLERQLSEANYKLLKIADLEAIKNEYPDASIKDVEELGERFMELRIAGISPERAYEAIQMSKNKPPKAMGKPKTSAPEKDYFTRDEVMNMSEADQIKNYDKIRASMSRW